MIKKISIFLLVALALTNWSNAQTSEDENFLQNEVPKEQVYLHLNSSLLFSGEKLLYKFYCLDSETNKLSDLSKIGWVILVNSDKEQVFKHKLNLEQGQSYSDFFIPSNLPSGAYKILGYTSWMLNAEENYFKQDIHILNPYQKENEGLILKDSIDAISQDSKTETLSDFDLTLNKDSFLNREEVVLSLDNTEKIKGNFSISVRRINSFNKPSRHRSTNFTEIYNNIRWNFSDTIILPEVRGSLITGRIIGKDKKVLQTKNLMVSFPGEESQVNIVSVDENGEFNFTMNNFLAVDELLLQLVDYKQDDFSIALKQTVQADISQLTFEKPLIYKGFKEYILEKSVNNQIENAYSATKADRSVYPKEEGYFFGNKLHKFNLDDYTRFPEVTQTFVEIIEYGRVKTNDDDGSHSILVRNQNTNGEFTLPALLIVDGVVVQDHDKLTSFETERIESIGLLRSKFFFGPEIYQGVVVVKTKEGDFPDEFREDYIKSTEVITTQNQKRYYSPNYKIEDLERIPDYRYQLWWNPEAKLDKDDLRFYTSDLDGDFEINLEGFTNEGKPISITKIFTVQ
ncbi:hypothetical protein LB465_16795 [Salegentibacter sp. LM13S]|uniref:hypothetical protein n=1 Tax=Salegentibacter lacus TaxID=2873599 RepID=UPI001CCC0EE6|nr:hypothetical protein [Salegentibacter lacus]MBZ9632442.1 hypothetical protein [Salegentibacter lacus]